MIKSFIQSLEADEWLFSADILVDIAHVLMLREQGILSSEDASKILRGLEGIQRTCISSIDLHSHEDVHTAIEATLIKRIGDAGGKMHTARSRNDEVATCIRMALREELLKVMGSVVKLRSTLIRRAEGNVTAIMPGYTHLQHAQPTTLAHHLIARADALGRDLARLLGAYERTNMNPLGSAAFASTGFNINRNRTAELLGFDSIVENSMDAVSTRDFVLETLSSLAILMTDLSSMAEELILWSTSEFDFIEIQDNYAARSSIMPQKKNPDFAELVRAKTGSVYGALVSALTICKSLPYAYNRDLQEITPHLLRAVRTTQDSTEVMSAVIDTMTVKKDSMKKKAAEGFTTATELADTIVRETGIPFRKAHEIVSRLSKLKKITLDDIDKVSSEVIGKKLSGSGMGNEAVRTSLDIMENIKKRRHGGPSPQEVKKMIAGRKKEILSDKRTLDAKSAKLKRAIENLNSEIHEARSRR
jgi:argininosuccinate lyase